MGKVQKLSLITTLLTSLLIAESAKSQNDTNSMNLDFERDGTWIVLPYIFSSEATGLTGGVGAIAQGLLQPQTTMVASVFGGVEQDVFINGEETTENTVGGLFAFDNLKVPYADRWFLSTLGYTMKIPKQNFYFDSRNNSDRDHGWTTPGTSSYVKLNLTYVLPMGEGLENPEGNYKIVDGFASGREGYGNGTPFVTGRTTMGINAFYQHQTFDNYDDAIPPGYRVDAPLEWNSQGVRFFLSHDNTDWKDNPSRGYSLFLQYSKDFGDGDSLQEWDFLEFKASKYFNLDTFSFTRQNVLAFNFWTAYSFSWENDEYLIPGIEVGRPPLWDGPRLGGYARMRAYDASRFSDKAAIYATAEYRAVIDWNPVKDGTFGEWVQTNIPLDWFQVVGFVEAGRVHDAYDSELLKDMKYDVGLSLRALAAELPVRFDVAYGDEGASAWVMVQHPFDM